MKSARAIGATAIFLALIAIYVFAFLRDSHRGPHRDEAEHLHAALRMARGERIFVDFAEHHSPLYYATLMPFAPEGDGVAAMRGYVARARAAAGVYVAIAIAVGAFVVFRASANVAAAITFVALILAGGPVWRDGLTDVRPDSPALAVWWCGAALALLGSRGVLRGAGAGLIVVAALISPKWPLGTLVIFAFFAGDLWRRRGERLASIIAAIAVSAAGIVAIALLSDLRLALFHVLELTTDMVDATWSDEAVARFHPFFGCPPLLRPWAVVPAAALVAVAWMRAREAFASPRLVASFFVAAIASLSEVLLLYPFPAVAPRYYVFWIFPAAVLIALAPRSVVALIAPKVPSFRRAIAAIPYVIAALAFAASFERMIPLTPHADSYWTGVRWIESRMRPGDTVWMEPSRHPIGARDASYYWFQFRELVPVALRAAKTEKGRRFLPAIEELDLPLCRVERGLDSNLRFVSDPRSYALLPVVAGCFERLRVRGVLTPSPIPRVWIVNRAIS